MISIIIYADLLKFHDFAFPIRRGAATVKMYGEYMFFETENVELALKIQTIIKNL